MIRQQASLPGLRRVAGRRCGTCRRRPRTRMFQRIADLQWRRRTPVGAHGWRRTSPVRWPAHRRPSCARPPRAGMRSYMRYWCDAFRLPVLEPEQIGTFRITNEHELADALATGRGVGRRAAAPGQLGPCRRLHVPGTRARSTPSPRSSSPIRLFESFVEFRESLGMTHPRAGRCRRLRRSSRRHPDAAAGWSRCWPTGTSRPRASTWTSSASARDSRPDPPPWRSTPARSCGPSSSSGTDDNVATILPEIVPPTEGIAPGADRAARPRRSPTRWPGPSERHPQDWHMLQRLWLADLDQSRLAERDAARAGCW